MSKALPLEGVKILDFSWVAAGPSATRYLADHGAMVIRAESATHLETLRITGPFRNNEAGQDRSAYYANYNAGKYSFRLNLNHPKAAEIAKRLVQWADIVVESYAPGVMKRFGLDYRSLREIKPDIIMASTSQMGQTGPITTYRGFGAQASALAGFCHITGWPDGEPLGPYGAHSDMIAHRYLMIGILSALEYRRRTGKGQYIDVSQFECALQFLSTVLLDYSVNGRVASRKANQDPCYAPHASYRCMGDDRWCVVAVTNDEEWRGLCRAIEKPELVDDPRFSTLSGRKRNEEELDRIIEEWTRSRSPEEVMHLMQAARVPAGIVEKGEDLHRDPQLEHRHHFWQLQHDEIGLHRYDFPGFRLSKTPGRIAWAAPLLGEHNDYICREVLGMSNGEFVELVSEGVFE